VEKALKNWSEETRVKCRDQGAARDLGMGGVQPRWPWGCCAQSLGVCARSALAEGCSCSQGEPGPLLDRHPCERVPGAGARAVSWAEALQRDSGIWAK